MFQSATPFGGASVTGTAKGTQGMEGLENTSVTAVDQLATLYSPPSERVLRKEIDHVDAVGRAFIAASPFLILATGGSQGARLLAQRRQAGLRPGRGRRPHI